MPPPPHPPSWHVRMLRAGKLLSQDLACLFISRWKSAQRKRACEQSGSLKSVELSQSGSSAWLKATIEHLFPERSAETCTVDSLQKQIPAFSLNLPDVSAAAFLFSPCLLYYLLSQRFPSTQLLLSLEQNLILVCSLSTLFTPPSQEQHTNKDLQKCRSAT